MKPKLMRLLLLLMILLSVTGAYPRGQQYDWPETPDDRGNPFLDRGRINHQYFIFSGTHPDTNNVLIYIKIPNSSMQFVKDGQAFTAAYEISVIIQKTDTLVASKIIRGKLNAKTFHASESPDLAKYELFQFPVSPGNYSVIMEIYDMETRKPLRQQDKLTVPDFSRDALAFSDIMFLDQMDLDHLDKLQPLMPPVRDAGDTSFCARIDLFANKVQHVHIDEKILNSQGKIVYQDSLDFQMTRKRNPIFYKLSQDLPFGQYTLQLKITGDNFEKTTEGKFYIKWEGHPASMPDMETAVASLYYIMDRDQWNEIKSAADSTQSRLLESYWKSRDPDPETEENELEDEYYRRVTYANRAFSVFQGSQAGWRTDRGRIYIIYGPPTDIDRPPVSQDNTGRYEIWNYHNLQKRFVFFDKYGDGDFRLISQE